MAAINTPIEWTDRSWNFLRGCSIESEGCQFCYAMRMAHRFSGPGKAYDGLTRMSGGRPKWTGEIKFVEKDLNLPYTWKKPSKIFVNSMSDLFHPNVNFDIVLKAVEVMLANRHHTYQILTKRPQIAVEFFEWLRIRGKHLYDVLCRAEHIHWGASTENQKQLAIRVPYLLQLPAPVKWLSCEPLLGPLTLRDYLLNDTVLEYGPTVGQSTYLYSMGLSPNYNEGAAALQWIRTSFIKWVVVGGESGSGSRPAEEEWIRSIKDQCQAHEVPVFVKQMGAVWARDNHAEDSKGGNWDEWPADLRVREYPAKI